MKRYDLELTATGPVMEEHEQGAFVPFSEVRGLAERLADATRQRGAMADSLRYQREFVTANVWDDEERSLLLEGIDSSLAGKLPERPDTEWTDTELTSTEQDYRELQVQHDQMQSKHKGALDLLHELREGAEIHLHNCKVCKNEEGVNNWTGKLARIDALLADQLPDPAVTVTETIRTAPERIWLQVGDQLHYHSEPFPSDTSEVSWCADSVMACEVPYVREDLAGKLPEHHAQHPDDVAVDRFAKAMKAKLADARAKGRSGWDDPAACPVQHLADLLLAHIGKCNHGTFEDIANFSMMLHQRGASPALLAGKLLFSSSPEGWQLVPMKPTMVMLDEFDSIIDYGAEDSQDAWRRMLSAAPKPESVKVRTITEGQEFELTTVLQSIANGFSDDPAHDAAALLNRIAGDVPWTGDSFQIPPRQGGEPCDFASPSSSPD